MPRQVGLLEESFKTLAPEGEAFVAAFYQRLLAGHPEVAPLFARVDMPAQRKKLPGALALAVETLRRPEVLFPALREMGYAGYGVKAEHYAAVGGALLETFAAFLGPRWTPALAQAWAEAYGAISAAMREGAARPA
jgi:hemoglobin-like flavoprotein